VIKRKAKGETVTVEEPEREAEEAPDLMAALQASIEAHAGTERRPARKTPGRGSRSRGGSRARR
jgi:non-homologous end joining protein Ku